MNFTRLALLVWAVFFGFVITSWIGSTHLLSSTFHIERYRFCGKCYIHYNNDFISLAAQFNHTEIYVEKNSSGNISSTTAIFSVFDSLKFFLLAGNFFIGKSDKTGQRDKRAKQ